MQTAQTKTTQGHLQAVTAPTNTATEPGRPASEAQISRLVGQVYACAPATEQQRLLAHLLNPLGALARVSVANGVFARSLFHSGWRDFQAPSPDVPKVHIDHVIDLADYVQKVRVEAIFAIAEMAKVWPGIASSVAWGQLVTGLLQHAKFHRIERDRDELEC